MPCDQLFTAQHKAALAREFALSADADALDQLDYLWSFYDSLATPDPRLPALFVRRDFILYVMTAAATLVDWKWADKSQSNSGYLKHLQMLLEAVQEQIAGFRVGRARVGAITTTAPRMPESGEPDPNLPYYRGDAIDRYPRRRTVV